jgi:hypothetical protein
MRALDEKAGPAHHRKGRLGCDGGSTNMRGSATRRILRLFFPDYGFDGDRTAKPASAWLRLNV